MQRLKIAIFAHCIVIVVYSGGTPSNINVLYASLKSTLGYNSVADSTGLSSFILPLLPLKSAKSCEIPRKFELIAVQGHPRSLAFVPIESAYATSFQSLIVTLDVPLTVFAILTHIARKQLVFPTPPLFGTRARGNPSNFWMELAAQKLDGWGYCTVKIA